MAVILRSDVASVCSCPSARYPLNRGRAATRSPVHWFSPALGAPRRRRLPPRQYAADARHLCPRGVATMLRSIWRRMRTLPNWTVCNTGFERRSSNRRGQCQLPLPPGLVVSLPGPEPSGRCNQRNRPGMAPLQGFFRHQSARTMSSLGTRAGSANVSCIPAVRRG